MLFLEIPPFDLLKEQSAPFPGFGEPQVFPHDAFTSYAEAVSDARQRVKEVFGIPVKPEKKGVAKLEEIIATARCAKMIKLF